MSGMREQPGMTDLGLRSEAFRFYLETSELFEDGGRKGFAHGNIPAKF